MEKESSFKIPQNITSMISGDDKVNAAMTYLLGYANALTDVKKKQMSNTFKTELSSMIIGVMEEIKKLKNLGMLYFFIGIKPIAEFNKELIKASKTGNLMLLKGLLAIPGINVNAKDNNGDTALMMASNEGNTEIAKLLLSKPGINVNAKGNYGDTALMMASYNGDEEIVKLLLDKPDININAKNKVGKTALIITSYNGDEEIVKLLLAKPGIDVNAKNIYGYRAFNCRYAKIVELLLFTGSIDVNSTNNNDGNTALLDASKNGHTEVVKVLLTVTGINVNAQNKYGKTALMNASKKGHTEIAKLLLKVSDIKVNLQDNDNNGDTALMMASKKGHIEIVNLLLRNTGIDVNVQNKYGDTALLYASDYRNIASDYRNIALYDYADISSDYRRLNLIYRHKDVVKLLLAVPDLKINIKNNDGETPLMLMLILKRNMDSLTYNLRK